MPILRWVKERELPCFFHFLMLPWQYIKVVRPLITYHWEDSETDSKTARGDTDTHTHTHTHTLECGLWNYQV